MPKTTRLPARYVLEQAIENRPEGQVHRARDTRRGEPCRVVVAHAEPTAALLLRQGHLAQLRLAHPHLARAGELAALADDTWFGASEWLTPFALPVVPEVLLEALPGWLNALQHLHQAGVVHGELRPEVLGLAADGSAKLADTGRRWRVGSSAEVDWGRDWALAAPEIVGLARVDGRSDLYMLGAVCLRWLTGLSPADDFEPALARLGAPWSTWLEGLLAPVPAHRFPSAFVALAELRGEAPAPFERPRLVTPFVGRRGEMDQLLGLAEEVADEGLLRRAHVVGPAGVGKSRLMEELRQRLCLRDMRVVSSRAHAGADNGPYSAWTPIVVALWGQLAPAVRAELAPLFAPLLPGLGAEAAPALEPRAERARLWRAFATLLEAAASEGLALFLDDWHAADAASRELADYLARALVGSPIFLVFASRDDEAGGPEEGGAIRLPLPPFGPQEVKAIFRGVCGDAPDGSLVTAWEEATEGNPALVEDCVLAFAMAQGPDSALEREAARASLGRARTVAALQAGRVSVLSPAGRLVALAAAVAGPRASLGLLQAVAALEAEGFAMVTQAEGFATTTQAEGFAMVTQAEGFATALNSEGFFGALEEAVAAGALVADAHGYRLDVPAALVLDGADAEGVASAHGRALDYLKLAAQFGEGVAAGQLAHHALAARRDADGAYYALAAAQDALRLFALGDAERWLAQGSHCLEHLADVPAEWRLGYLVARADAQRYAGCGLEAAALYGRALAQAPQERQSALLTSLGIALSLQSRSEEAEHTYRRALEAAATPLDRARGEAALARLFVRTGRFDEAIRVCRAVLAEADAPAASRSEALGLMGLVLTTMQPARPEEGLEFLTQAEALALETGDRLALTNALMLAGNARMALGQLPAARLAFERYYLLCNELGLPDEALCAVLNLAQVAYEEGRLNEAWNRAKLGAETAASSGNRIYQAFGKAYTGLAGSQLGYLADAEQALAEAQAIADELGDGYLGLQMLVSRLELALFLGRLGKAEELGLEVMRRQEASGIHEFAARHALLMGQLYELADEITPAVEQFQRARTLAESTGHAALLAGVQLGLAAVALRAGQLAVAQTRAEEALAMSLEAGAGLPQLRSQLLLARLHWLRGDQAAAGRCLREAEALATLVGAPHWQALVWQATGRIEPEQATLRMKANAFLQFYLNQLPPRARQEFLHWPERRDVMIGRPTGPLAPLDAPRAGDTSWPAS